MRSKAWLLILLASVLPVQAEDVRFEGHVLDVDPGVELRPIRSVASARYQVPGDRAAIVARARACVSGIQGATLDVAQADGGPLRGHLNANFRSMLWVRSVRARMAIEAGDGQFQMILSDLQVADAASANARADAYAPFGQQSAGWGNALQAAIGIETRIVDCLYR